MAPRSSCPGTHPLPSPALPAAVVYPCPGRAARAVVPRTAAQAARAAGRDAVAAHVPANNCSLIHRACARRSAPAADEAPAGAASAGAASAGAAPVGDAVVRHADLRIDLRPDAASALALLEAAFPSNTRDINVEYMLLPMRYLCKLDGTVVGLFHTEKNGKRHFLKALAVSTDHRGKGLGTYMLRQAACETPDARSLYVQADTAKVRRAGAGDATTSAQAFYEKHGMVKCDVRPEEHCIALKAPALELRELNVDQATKYLWRPGLPGGLITSNKHAFAANDIASLPAEVLVEDSSDGEEEQTDEEGAPAVYDVDSIPAGELPDTASDNMGNGGCTAHALFKLGVFATVAGAKATLNAAGDRILAKRREEVRDDYERERVYKPDDYWLHEVIKIAVVEAGYDFHKLDLLRDSLADEVRKGAVLIDGVQNQHWMKGNVSNADSPTNSWRTNAPDYTGLGPEAAPGRWRHSIAVQNGRVLEQNDDEFSARWLWLDGGSDPNPERGYMRHILKAYVITQRRAARKQMQVCDTGRGARLDARDKRRAEVAADARRGAKRARN